MRKNERVGDGILRVVRWEKSFGSGEGGRVNLCDDEERGPGDDVSWVRE